MVTRLPNLKPPLAVSPHKLAFLNPKYMSQDLRILCSLPQGLGPLQPARCSHNKDHQLRSFSNFRGSLKSSSLLRKPLQRDTSALLFNWTNRVSRSDRITTFRAGCRPEVARCPTPPSTFACLPIGCHLFVCVDDASARLTAAFRTDL